MKRCCCRLLLAWVILGEYLEATGQKTTRAFVGFWDGGSADAGEFQYQVFLVERHISVAPSTARPVVGFWPNAVHAREPATAKVAAQMGYAGIGFTSTGSWCEEGLRTGKLPPFADPANPKSFAATVLGAGLKPIFYIGENQLPLRTGIWPTRPAEAQALGKYLGQMSAAAKANGWFIEDLPGENYQGFLGKDVPEIGRVDAMWREGIRVILGEIRAAVAPRPISLCRSWVKQLEVFDLQDFTLPFDTDDNYTWADKWMEAYQQRMPLQPNLAMMVCSPACVINRNKPANDAPPIAPRPGKSAREAADLDFVAARAANLGNVYHIESVSLTNATPEEIAIQKKWNTWHQDNREYLQYTQKLETSKPLPKNVYGLMHLRNEHHGKYGYVAWWNTQSTAVTVAPRIDLPKWMLRIDPDKLVVKSVGSGKAVPFTVRGGVIQLDEVPTPMWSYEVLELSTR